MVRQKKGGRMVAAKRRTVMKSDGKSRLKRRRSGGATQRLVAPKARSPAKRIVIGETPSSLASILAERVADAR